MNRKNTTAIFGQYDPYILDNALCYVHRKYIKSQEYIQLREEEEKYLLEKWNLMRKFFDAENLCEDIERINQEFRIKCILQKRKEYNEIHREELKEKCKIYNESHREQINRRRGEKITCECGAIVRRDYLTQHQKSEKHKTNL